MEQSHLAEIRSIWWVTLGAIHWQSRVVGHIQSKNAAHVVGICRHAAIAAWSHANGQATVANVLVGIGCLQTSHEYISSHQLQ